MVTGSGQTDLQLLLRISEGDESAFAELYRAYTPQLLPFINAVVRSDAVGDEVIQETFLRLWIARDKLPEVREPRAWIFRIAANICYTHLRRVIKEKEILQRLAPRQPQQEDQVQEIAQASEVALLIHKAIDQLSPQRKKIYRLSREKGLTIPEIATHLGLSASTVKNTLVSSLQFIREFLSRHGYEVPVFILALLFF